MRFEAIHKADFEELKLQQSNSWMVLVPAGLHASCLAMTQKTKKGDNNEKNN